MKFPTKATLLLLAVCAIPSTAGQSADVDHYKDGTKPIFDADIILAPNGVFMRRHPIGNGLYILVPRNGEERRKLQEVRARDSHGRHLQELTVVSPAGKDMTFSRQTDFVVSGVSPDLQAPKFVFQSPEKTYTVEADEIVNGTASESIGGFTPGIYSWYFAGTLNGQEIQVAGSDFTYGSTPQGTIVRNSGPTAVAEGPWLGGGQILGATGRIYYSTNGVDFACSGTVIKDSKSGRSLILTAAHCVWDDIDENFGANVIFIPNRDSIALPPGETGADIHRVCTMDVCGCWTISGGVVHDKWMSTPWPARLDYDYGFYVVDDDGSHSGNVCGSEALDVAVDELTFAVDIDIVGKFGYSFGYTLEYNPDFRYCADTFTTNQPSEGIDTAWLSGCELSPGSSGGPMLVDFNPATGSGKIVSVNSWSFGGSPGNGSPLIDESEARCLVNAARSVDIASLEANEDGEEGIFVNCYDRPCVEDDSPEAARKLRGHRARRFLCEK